MEPPRFFFFFPVPSISTPPPFSFTNQELEQAITDNGIIILKDEYVEIGGNLILAGRDDVGYYEKRERLSAEEILEGADKNNPVIGRYFIRLYDVFCSAYVSDIAISISQHQKYCQ